MSIPKVIHYCWFGNGKMPSIAKKCIKSWKKYCKPDDHTTETMIYYNHVYSFIFSKLSDEERFAFTKKAIILQKRRKL